MTKRILIITPGFARDESDTSCIPYLQDYVLTLAERVGKNNVSIITLQYPFDRKDYSWHGIEVHSCRGKNRRGIVKLWVFLRCFLKAVKITSGGNFILHTFWLTDASLIGKVIARFKRLPHIITLMGQDVRKENKYLRVISLKNTRVVAFNDKMAEALAANTGFTTPYKISLGIRNTVLPEPSSPRTIDMLFVGSMIPLKQPFVFVEIVKRVQESIPGVKATMIGDGVLFQELKQKVAGLPVTLTGALPRDEVIRYMHRSKILVHTSNYEGQATVFSEALMQGMYAVCFDVGRPDAEKLYMCRDALVMSEQIIQLLQRPLSFEPDRSYSMEQVVEAYMELYKAE